MTTVEVVETGNGQAIRLPEEFRFETPTVSIRREGEAVILEPAKATRWPQGFFEDIRIDDPGAYARPFTLYGHSTYQHGEELMEYICNENNKDLPHIVGKDPRNRYFKK